MTNTLPTFYAPFNCFEVTIRESCKHKCFFKSLLSWRFLSCFTARKESRTLTYLSQQMITILKLSQMHENHLHADVHRRYMYCNLEWPVNCFPALTDPVPTHQRYHSDFSSSSESPSVTSSDPDYGQGSKIDWNIHQSTSLLKGRMGCMKLYKLYIWLYIQYIWYRAWCL